MHFLRLVPIIFIIKPVASSSLYDTETQIKLQLLENRQRIYEQELKNQQKINDMQQEAITRLERCCMLTNDVSGLVENKRHAEFKPNSLYEPLGHSKIHNQTHSLSPNSRISAIQRDKNNVKKRQAASPIGFLAYVDHTVKLGRGQTIVFNRAITNEGGAYSIHTGVFTCPVDGLYMFSFTVTIRDHDQVWAHLVVNSSPEAGGVADGYHNNQDMQGGATVILKLNTGDVVYVNSFFDRSYDIDENDSGHFNTFTGALLYQYDTV